jgi:hypothetical protein
LLTEGFDADMTLSSIFLLSNEARIPNRLANSTAKFFNGDNRKYEAFYVKKQTNFCLLKRYIWPCHKNFIYFKDKIMDDKMILKLFLTWFVFLLGLAATVTAQEHLQEFPNASKPLVVDSLQHEVRLLATYQPDRFSGILKFVPNYHLLVWNGGGAAGEALFSTPIADTTLLAALESLGAVAGNNLTMAAWEKRHDAKHLAPQTRIAGTSMEILVWWKGLEAPRMLSDLLEDPGSRGIDFRFGGNRALIHHWHSGCLVCLYSCPGSKVGNAAYTVRDYVTGATKFSPRKERMPKPGSEVVIILRVQ